MATILILLESQHPDAKNDHAINYSSWLEEGDTIATASVTTDSAISIGDGTLLPQPEIIDDSVVVFWLYGGESGKTYNGTISITTSEGRTDVSDWQISIIDPYP